METRLADTSNIDFPSAGVSFSQKLSCALRLYTPTLRRPSSPAPLRTFLLAPVRPVRLCALAPLHPNTSATRRPQRARSLACHLRSCVPLQPFHRTSFFRLLERTDVVALISRRPQNRYLSHNPVFTAALRRRTPRRRHIDSESSNFSIPLFRQPEATTLLSRRWPATISSHYLLRMQRFRFMLSLRPVQPQRWHVIFSRNGPENR